MRETSSRTKELLDGIEAFRLDEVPRRSRNHALATEENDDETDQRFAALISSYHSRTGAVALGWRRSEEGGPVDVLLGGTSLVGSRAGDGVVLGLPAGAVSAAMGLSAAVLAWHPSVKTAYHPPREAGSTFPIPPELTPRQILDSADLDEHGRRKQ